MWTTPEKHTKRRETLGNANQNKTLRRAGYKKVYGKRKKKRKKERKKKKTAKERIKEPYEMLNKRKTLTTIARLKKAKEKALKWTSQSGKELYENHSEKNRALQNAKKNNKTTK